MVLLVVVVVAKVVNADKERFLRVWLKGNGRNAYISLFKKQLNYKTEGMDETQNTK